MANKKQKLQERRHKKEVRKRFFVLSVISTVIATLSLIIGAYNTGFEYAAAISAIENGASAPAEVAFVAAIPYAIAAVILFAASGFFFYKSKKKEKSCISENN